MVNNTLVLVVGAPGHKGFYGKQLEEAPLPEGRSMSVVLDSSGESHAIPTQFVRVLPPAFEMDCS